MEQLPVELFSKITPDARSWKMLANTSRKLRQLMQSTIIRGDGDYYSTAYTVYTREYTMKYEPGLKNITFTLPDGNKWEIHDTMSSPNVGGIKIVIFHEGIPLSVAGLSISDTAYACRIFTADCMPYRLGPFPRRPVVSAYSVYIIELLTNGYPGQHVYDGGRVVGEVVKDGFGPTKIKFTNGEELGEGPIPLVIYDTNRARKVPATISAEQVVQILPRLEGFIHNIEPLF